MTRGAPAAALVPLLAAATGLGAQEAPRYGAWLDGARFAEEARVAAVVGQGEGALRVELAREGVLVLRRLGEMPGGAQRLEAWYDSLAAVRSAEGTTLAPDTDGLVGGRWRGTLGAAGGWSREAAPFIPDELAEVHDFAALLDDLLPPLPGRALAPGERWDDRRGTRITRLPDSLPGADPVERYRIERSGRRVAPAGPAADTLRVRGSEEWSERGTVAWRAGAGLLAWTREEEVRGMVPKGGPVRVPVASVVARRTTLRRLPPGR
ncbi:MAG: hypothetical protein NW201_08685 [Gemmatimonadales bacterium]|nr:hypothetical protein [Gemmatimonadales bacterium]